MLKVQTRLPWTGQHRQSGFTLLEIMVVVVVTAVIGGFSIFGLAQANERRYSTQAENLLQWLGQINDLAAIEGITYGVRQQGQQLSAVVFYHQRWLPVAMPEQFRLYDNAKIQWPLAVADTGQAESTLVKLPDLILDGYPGVDSDVLLVLGFEGQTVTFNFGWNSEQAKIAMESQVR